LLWFRVVRSVTAVVVRCALVRLVRHVGSRYGGQVRVWSDKFGSGMAVGERFGEVWSVEVRNDKAVMFRCGEIGSGQARFVMAVGERYGLSGFGEVCFGGRGAVRSGMLRMGAVGSAWFLILT
jgi:hypothetical protein